VQPSFLLDTAAGKLHLYVQANRVEPGATCFARFHDVNRARRLLGDTVLLNPHSGKWNHHFFTTDVDTSVDILRRRLQSVLEEAS